MSLNTTGFVVEIIIYIVYHNEYAEFFLSFFFLGFGESKSNVITATRRVLTVPWTDCLTDCFLERIFFSIAIRLVGKGATGENHTSTLYTTRVTRVIPQRKSKVNINIISISKRIRLRLPPFLPLARQFTSGQRCPVVALHGEPSGNRHHSPSQTSSSTRTSPCSRSGCRRSRA